MTNQVSGILHVRAMNVAESDQFEIAGTGGVTLAYSVQPDGSVKTAVAMCSLDDHFNRGLGSKIAIGRLQCSRDIESVATIERETIAFLAKEVLGVDELPTPNKGRHGEYFWHTSDLDVSRLLMTSVKLAAADLLDIWLRRNNMRTAEPLDDTTVQIVRKGKNLAFAYHPEPLQGVEAVA